MNRDDCLASIAKYMGRLEYEVRALNAIGRFDINTTTENFLVPILRILFGCPELQNQNEIHQNFPAVDLGCRKTRISFQVTSDASSDKVVTTLEKFRQHDLNAHFDSVNIVTVGEKQGSYVAKALDDAIAALPVFFSKADNILDLNDLLSRISQLETAKINVISSYLKSEFERLDQHSKFRESLDLFVGFSKQKILVEKASKKYIPRVFIETHSAKEEMRLFAVPLFFYRKVHDTLTRFDYRRLNDLLRLAQEPELTSDLDPDALLEGPQTLEQLPAWAINLADSIQRELVKVQPLSWMRDEALPKYEPRYKDSAAWSIIRVKAESMATGLTRRLQDADSYLGLMQKRIFLVTSMAGQGKTNFVCDLVENQFTAFDVPCVFVPARELNMYSAGSRLFGFISNNRYAPGFSRLHEFLDLFNQVAKSSSKPFVLIIDGINEVRDLDGFCQELKDLCNAVCQYDFVKLIITCRSEFFEGRYRSLLDEPCATQIHRVSDLRSEMSERSKDRLLAAYFDHFDITGLVTGAAEEFLKNDLLLLRIFCELHEHQDIGRTTEIYKGDVFEAFLHQRIECFPVDLQPKVLPLLAKMASGMLAADQYATLSVRDFESEEQQIVRRLVADDIILRQEVPGRGLASLGDFVVSFTYDDLRDFIIAYSLVHQVTSSDAHVLETVLSRLPGRPIFEGVYKYVYLLARKGAKTLAISACERAADFIEHFSLNVHLIPPSVQNDADVKRVRDILSDTSVPRRVLRITQLLIRRPDPTDPLNTMLLLDHMNSLDAERHNRFVIALFSHSNDLGEREWLERLRDLVDEVVETSSKTGLSRYSARWLAFLLHAASDGSWAIRERTVALFRGSFSEERCQEALTLIQRAEADTVRSMAAEIELVMDTSA